MRIHGLVGLGVGGLKGGGCSRWAGVGENPIPKACEFPPQWARSPPLLASSILSWEPLRLAILTLEATKL